MVVLVICIRILNRSINTIQDFIYLFFYFLSYISFLLAYQHVSMFKFFRRPLHSPGHLYAPLFGQLQLLHLLFASKQQPRELGTRAGGNKRHIAEPAATRANVSLYPFLHFTPATTITPVEDVLEAEVGKMKCRFWSFSDHKTPEFQIQIGKKKKKITSLTASPPQPNQQEDFLRRQCIPFPNPIKNLTNSPYCH